MPLFIDRHELCDLVTAEAAAQRHLNDIQVQHLYNCRKLSYWFDEKRRTAFCLFEAPDKASLEEMHKHVHGNIPNQITEVDAGIISSFLKQIERLPSLDKLEIPGALPTFLACDVVSKLLNIKLSDLKTLRKEYITTVNEMLNQYGGNVISQVGSFFLVAFQSGPAAIKCAIKMHKKFYINPNVLRHKHQLKIGISGGIPNENGGGNIKASVRLAKRLCYMSNKKTLVTLEVKNLFQSESMKVIIKGDSIKSVSPDDVRFTTELLDFMEKNWKNHSLHANDFEAELRCSKSQVYRKMTSLIGQSPNIFIKEYRLVRAKELLGNKHGNISEIAFDCGFSSPSYFTKCFYKKYGIKPSDYSLNI